MQATMFLQTTGKSISKDKCVQEMEVVNVSRTFDAFEEWRSWIHAELGSRSSLCSLHGQTAFCCRRLRLFQMQDNKLTRAR